MAKILRAQSSRSQMTISGLNGNSTNTMKIECEGVQA
jgi:hypothetical protein